MRDTTLYARATAVLAIALLASFGLCGLSSVLPDNGSIASGCAVLAAILGIMSFVGLLVAALLWFIAAVFEG